MGTATPSVKHETNYSINSFQARGGLIEIGTWVPTTLGAYTSVGEVLTFNMKTKPNIVIFMAQLAAAAPTTIASGIDYRWDQTNGSVRAFLGSTATGLGGFEATTTWAGTTVAVPYIVFSW
jgi:hypothetical protein